VRARQPDESNKKTTGGEIIQTTSSGFTIKIDDSQGKAKGEVGEEEGETSLGKRKNS